MFNYVKSSPTPLENEYFLQHPFLPLWGSNYGRFIVRKRHGYHFITNGSIRRRCNKESKYEYVMAVRHNNQRKLKPASHLIMQCFCLTPSEGETMVDHIDGDSENNSIDNLCWVTPKQNSNNLNNINKK